MIKFLTRTGTLTAAMPRLYVSCHPGDFEMHFRTICSDIFAAQENCAVFYEEDPAEPCRHIQRSDLRLRRDRTH